MVTRWRAGGRMMGRRERGGGIIETISAKREENKTREGGKYILKTGFCEI